MISRAVWEGVIVTVLVVGGVVLLLDQQALLGIGILLVVIAYYLRLIAGEQRGQTELLALIAEDTAP